MFRFTKHLFKLITAFLLINSLTLNIALAETSQYQEHDFLIDDTLAASSCHPTAEEKSPLVLLLHGFASKKDEVGDLSKRLAQQLCEQGIGSLRIAYRGWGESKGKMTDITLATELDDIDMAYSYIENLPWVDQQRIGVVGFSMGGGLAIIDSQRNPQRYKSLVTWSSAGDFEKDLKDLLGQAIFDEAAKTGMAYIDLGWRQFTLGKGFFESLSEYDIAAAISQYDGAYLAIAGSDDFSSAYSQDYVTVSQAKPKHALIIPGADHIFGVLGDDQSTAQHVIKETVTWLEATL